MSQEWDEVVHEVQLMITRLDAFHLDLLAAAVGGKLTEDQCQFVNNIVVVTSAASLCFHKLHVEETSEAEEEGDEGRSE